MWLLRVCLTRISSQLPVSDLGEWRHIFRWQKMWRYIWLLFNWLVDWLQLILTVDRDSPTWEYGWYQRSKRTPTWEYCWYWRLIRIHLLENTVDIWSVVDFAQKSVKIDRRYGFIPQKKWTWTQKNREHWPRSPMLHNNSDLYAHFFSRWPISSASHKTTHKKETNTHWQSVRWTQSQKYFKEELIVAKLFSEYLILYPLPLASVRT